MQIEEKVRRIDYVCAKCGSEDTMKLWPAEPVPPALNCWNCHSGQGIELAKMLQTGNGMFQKIEEEEPVSLN